MRALLDPAPAPTHTDVFRHRLRVYWEDTDAGGVVFYANYLKFFERGRTEWLRALGVSQQAMRDETGAVFIVADTAVRYLQPARLDDEIDITTRIVEAGRASLVIDQTAWRVHPDTGAAGDRLAEGRIRIGCVQAGTFRPQRIPSLVLDVLDHRLPRAHGAMPSPPSSTP
jgi:acyl-CoA thioester hydrolase